MSMADRYEALFIAVANQWGSLRESVYIGREELVTGNPVAVRSRLQFEHRKHGIFHIDFETPDCLAEDENLFRLLFWQSATWWFDKLMESKRASAA